MTARLETDIFSVTLPGPEPLKFNVPGHPEAYRIPYFRPYFGSSFANRFRDCWIKAAAFSEPSTSYNYFKAVRTAMMIVARKGAADKTSSEASILRALRQNRMPDERTWAEVLSNLAGHIVNIGDKTFIDSTNPSSRNKKAESLRMGLRWLAGERLIPDIEFECRRLEERLAKPSKCIASLALEAGRLKIAGLTTEDAIQAIVDFNRSALEEMRHCLWLELRDDNDLFSRGEAILSDHSIPSIEEAERFDKKISRADIRRGDHLKKLGLSPSQAFGLAIKIFRHRATGGTFASTMPLDFARSIVDHSTAQTYFEATTKSLNAAYHIVMIDADANCQPMDDIPLNCFVDKIKRGRQAVRSLYLQKNRKAGQQVPAKLKEDVQQTELYLQTKSASERPSGVVVIEIWKKLTRIMREKKGPTSKWLWLWRIAGKLRVGVKLNSVMFHAWRSFLARHAENKVFGGLPITRPMIRTTVRNARSDSRDLDFVVEQARMGHASARTQFEYLSEGAMRASLSMKIREFFDQWEATNLLDVETAAQILGVPSAELYRRAQLGLENGLSFLSVAELKRQESTHEAPRPKLSKQTRVLRVTQATLIQLELARRALRRQFAIMMYQNPLRLLRTWIPWMAIIEGYCEKLEKSRFQVQMRRARATVEAKLQSGELRMPLLW